MRFSVIIACSLFCSFSAAAQPPQTAPFPPHIASPGSEPYPGVISLTVDARDTDRRIVQISERVPVSKSGPVTFLYPQWIPGHHSPRGPIDKFAGVEFYAGGEKLEWKRDPVDVYAFHVDAPEGAKTVDIKAQYLSPTSGAQGRIEITPELMDLQWDKFILYPAGYPARGIDVKLSLLLPRGWSYASALTPQTGVAGRKPITFETTNLETLVDSPMFAGAHFARVALDDGSEAPVHLNVFGDDDDLIKFSDEQLNLHKKLVEQADKLFGARHYDRYDFLVELSDTLGGIGLEHHRSSEDGPGAKYFVKQDEVPRAWNLLPHEYVHSWNGKFRRPADLYTDNYDVPMRDSLLWVYEGMTQYWGQVLSARSGMWSRDTALEAMAMNAAAYDNRVGRAWRPLEDTTNDPIILARRPQGWNSWQRAEDYYNEGLLIWLDADTLIREKTNGQKSLDDFARAFFGVDPGSFTPLTYTFDDVVATLNGVMKYDWAGFLNARVNKSGGPAPLDGVKRGGWRLVYGDKENAYLDKTYSGRKLSSFIYSVGFAFDQQHMLTAVQWDGPAFNAGLKVGDQLVAVNDDAITSEKMKKAIVSAKDSKAPIRLLVKSGDRYKTVSLDYHGGLRIPRLERIDGAPDRLGDILTAK